MKKEVKIIREKENLGDNKKENKNIFCREEKKSNKC